MMDCITAVPRREERAGWEDDAVLYCVKHLFSAKFPVGKEIPIQFANWLISILFFVIKYMKSIWFDGL